MTDTATRKVRCAPTAGMLVRDDQGRILLQRRSDNGLWGLPGGHLSPGESLEECAIREVMEETGWRVQITGLLGIYSDPEFQTYTYPDGNTVQFVATVFEALAVEHTGVMDAESLSIEFFSPDSLPDQLVRTSIPQLADACSTASRPFIR